MIGFQLVSLSGVKYDGEAYEITLPTLEGQIGVLQNHMPLVSVATTGVIIVRHTAREIESAHDYYAISGGVIEVQNNVLRVLVDEADHADDINEAEAEAAMERAKQMKAEATDQVSLEHAQSLVDRHAVRLHVASLRRRHLRR